VYTNNNEESVTYDNFSVKSFTLAMNSVYLLLSMDGYNQAGTFRGGRLRVEERNGEQQ
jgi:hypothetical protein